MATAKAAKRERKTEVALEVDGSLGSEGALTDPAESERIQEYLFEKDVTAEA